MEEHVRTTNAVDQSMGSGPRFGSNRSTIRSEDVPLITGCGRFTDDIAVAGQAHAAFVRASVAPAEIRAIDVSAAANMPGVLAVISGEALVGEIGAIAPVAIFPGRNGNPMFQARMPVLPAARVRYVGEAVAIVVAETAQQALDAAEAVNVDLASSPATSDVTRALSLDAPAVWAEVPNNNALDWEDGDAEAVAQAFARAAHVARVQLDDTR